MATKSFLVIFVLIDVLAPISRSGSP